MSDWLAGGDGRTRVLAIQRASYLQLEHLGRSVMQEVYMWGGLEGVVTGGEGV